MKPLTGDPNVSPHVLKANELHCKIIEKADMGEDVIVDLGFTGKDTGDDFLAGPGAQDKKVPDAGSGN